MTIDIVFCLDRNVIRPMIAAMNSIAMNAADPGSLRFNVSVPAITEDAAAIESAIERAFPDPAFQWRTGSTEPPEWVRDYVRGRIGPDGDDLTLRRKAMKYSRLYLTEMFPDLGKFIYFDCDVIIIDDVAKLWDEAQLTPEMPFAAARHLFFGPLYFRRPLANWRAGRTIKKPFNSGMFVSDAPAWKDGPIARLRAILDWDTREGFTLFGLQDEPILNLTFTDYFDLRPRWNRCGFGNQPFVARLLKKPMEQISVLHWSGGHRKPWNDPEIAYGEYWWTYDLGPLED